MSRIGKLPIIIPQNVLVEIEGAHIKIKGAKGTLERNFCPAINVIKENNMLTCVPTGTSKQVMAFWGMTRSLLNNMIIGVDKGFIKKLIIEGVGYRANVDSSTLTLNVGYSSPVKFNLPKEISAIVDKDNIISIQGIDKELVGLVAAQVRAVRKPEPYKGKGIRYADEYIVRKVGKAGGKK